MNISESVIKTFYDMCFGAGLVGIIWFIVHFRRLLFKSYCRSISNKMWKVPVELRPERRYSLDDSVGIAQLGFGVQTLYPGSYRVTRKQINYPLNIGEEELFMIKGVNINYFYLIKGEEVIQYISLNNRRLS